MTSSTNETVTIRLDWLDSYCPTNTTHQWMVHARWGWGEIYSLRTVYYLAGKVDNKLAKNKTIPANSNIHIQVPVWVGLTTGEPVRALFIAKTQTSTSRLAASKSRDHTGTRGTKSRRRNLASVEVCNTGSIGLRSVLSCLVTCYPCVGKQMLILQLLC